MLQPFFKNLFPASLTGQILVAAGAGTASLAVILGFGTWYHRYNTEPYKYGVCWPHYQEKHKEGIKRLNYDDYESRNRDKEYKDCMKAARKGGKIYPPTKE